MKIHCNAFLAHLLDVMQREEVNAWKHYTCRKPEDEIDVIWEAISKKSETAFDLSFVFCLFICFDLGSGDISLNHLNWCWIRAELKWNCLNFVSDPFSYLSFFSNQFKPIQPTAKVVISATFQMVSNGTFLLGKEKREKRKEKRRGNEMETIPAWRTQKTR